MKNTKKTLAIVIALALVLTCFASTAFAVKAAWGSRVIYCEPNQEVALYDYGVAKPSHAGQLYVRHYLWGEYGGTYTNYFRATSKTTSALGSRSNEAMLGGKWMAPDGAFYVTSASIKAGSGWYACAWGRGNTDYGLSRIEISGYFETAA